MQQKMLASDPKNGAYTELFAGLSTTIKEKDNGGWGELLTVDFYVQISWLTKTILVSPFGKVDTPRKDLVDEELCTKYWEWSEKQVAPYL